MDLATLFGLTQEESMLAAGEHTLAEALAFAARRFENVEVNICSPESTRATVRVFTDDCGQCAA